MSRYLEVEENVYTTLGGLLDKRFNSFATLNFKLVFDLKKRISKGKIVLASTEVATEKLRFLTSDNENPEGYDYLIIIDKVAWEYADDIDRERLLSHELNHIFITEKGKLSLVDHDVNDFQLEINKNHSKPNWNIDLSTLTTSIYEQESDRE